MEERQLSGQYAPAATSQAANATATEDLWQEFADRLRRFIASRVSDPDAVDDILQEAFVKIHRRSDTLRDPARLTSWVFRITRNTIVDYHRAAPRRREIAVDDIAADVPTRWELSSFEETHDLRQEIAACVQPLLEELPAMYRDAVELVELRGLTQTEAARRAGVSVSGMKSRVQRGRSQLHKTLRSWCEIAVDPRGAPTSCAPVASGRCASPDRAAAPGEGS